MQIAGLEKTSFIDYPGQIATVIFTPGCNLRCYFCHNWNLIDEEQGCFSDEEVLSFLEKRRGRIDAVVFSGGEPTLQTGLFDMMLTVKAMGYRIKLDTNGTRPEVVEQLIRKQLLDYIAMDVKAPPSEKYRDVCGVPVDLEAVNQSIRLIMSGSIPYEFRTTYLPSLTIADISEIASWIYGARRYVLQQYRRPHCDAKVIDVRIMEPPHTHEYIRETVALIAPKLQEVDTRGI